MNNRDDKTHLNTQILQPNPSSPSLYESINEWSEADDQQQIGGNMEQNILPDLMRVYDSLTQVNTENPRQTNSSISTDSRQMHNFQPPETNDCVEKDQYRPLNYDQFPVGQPQQLVGTEPIDLNYKRQTPHQYLANPHDNAYDTYDDHNQRDTMRYDYNTYPRHQAPNQTEQELEQYLHPPFQNQSHVYSQDERHLSNYHVHDKSNINDFYQYDDPQSSSTRKRFASSSSNNIAGSDFSSNTVKPSMFKSRKKGINDARWSKRFTWPDELHANFVSAIFEVGLKHASPSFILEHLSSSPCSTADDSEYDSTVDSKNHEDKTLNAIKIYLQKYRCCKPKSQKEFMENFSKREDNRKSPGDKKSKQIPYAGAIAAYLTFLSLANEGKNKKITAPSHATNRNQIITVIDPPKSGGESSDVVSTGDEARNSTSHSRGHGLVLPQLTEEEKQSPLGSAMAYFLGLFFSLQQQLAMQKKQNQSNEINESQKC